MRLEDLPGLGKKSSEMLAMAGILDVEELKNRGSVQTFLAVRRKGIPVSLNLLWALEGALTGQNWKDVARQHRISLLIALDDAERR
jgi:DNA transformation protein